MGIKIDRQTEIQNNFLVTVLLITYNHANSFRTAINSVLEQETCFGYQIIVLDDASTDGTSDIVREYEHLPNVKCIIREKNIGGTKNIYNALELIDTKYFAMLETDDYWCDKHKLQKQVDILEKNPDCSFCAHNTLVKYTQNNTSRLFINSKTRKIIFPPKRISQKFYIEPHTSSRLYRTECLNLDEIKNPVIATYDIATNFYFLTKGSLYYMDEIMSVYNYTGTGVFSTFSALEQRYKSAVVIYQLNKEFSFKYNKLLSRFFARWLNLGFFKYFSLKIQNNPEKLDIAYKNVLENYKKDYLRDLDIKPILRITIPIGKKKKFVFDLHKEKERA